MKYLTEFPDYGIFVSSLMGGGVEFPNVTLCDADDRVCYNGAQPGNEVWYQSSDGKVIEKDSWDNQKPTSNTCVDGFGVMTFSADVKTTLGWFFDRPYDEESRYKNLLAVRFPDGIEKMGNMTVGMLEAIFRTDYPLKSLYIGSGTTKISDEAIMMCPWLETITVSEKNPAYKVVDGCLVTMDGETALAAGKIERIPEGVTNIESFLGSFSQVIEKLFIPKSVTAINSSALICMGNLDEITVDEENPEYKSENNCLLTKDGTTLLRACNKSTIPASVTSFGESVMTFGELQKIEEITIPKTLTTIKFPQFQLCPKLKRVTIEEGHQNYVSDDYFIYDKEKTTIKEFYRNDIETVEIPSSVTTLEGAFAYATSLTALTVPDSVTTVSVMEFCVCTKLEDLVLGSGLKWESNDSLVAMCFKLKKLTARMKTAPAVSNSAFYCVPKGGTFYYPEGSDYSAWTQILKKKEWTCQTFSE